MKIVNAGYELINEESVTKQIERIARICYKSEGYIKDGTDVKMLGKLMENQHYAMFEHASLVYEVSSTVYQYIRLVKNDFMNMLDFTKSVKETSGISRIRETSYEYKEDNVRFVVSGNIRAWIEFFNYCAKNRISDEVFKPIIADLYKATKGVVDFRRPDTDYTVINLRGAKRIEDFSILSPAERMVHETFSVLMTADRGCCYDKDTKVLTTEGWKFFKDVTEDDKYISLDENNNLCEMKAKQIVIKPFSGKLHHWHSSQIDLMVTPNHNMWLGNADNPNKWDFIKSEDANNKRYRFKKSANPTMIQGFDTFVIDGCDYKNNFQSPFNKPLKFDANTFFELLGWWVTDGSISEGKNSCGNRITIVQSKKFGRKRIKELLNILDLSYSEYGAEFRINCPQLYKWLKNNFIQNENFRKTYYVRIPRWFYNTLSCNNLKAFLNGIIGGDGTPHTKSDGFQIYTASEGFAEDLVELALYIGMCANKYTIPERDRDWKKCVSHCKEQYVVSLVTTNEHFFRTKNNTGKDEVEYNDNVYCVELPVYHRLYVMRNGKACWCGNTHEMVRMRDCSFAQESTRYCNYSNGKFGNEITVVKPVFFEEGSPAFDSWKTACSTAETQYNYMVNELGIPAQQARDVLPTSVKADIAMTANLQEWRHVFELRACDLTGPAHPQMKEVMCPLCVEMQEAYPFAFGDLHPDMSYVHGYEKEEVEKI